MNCLVIYLQKLFIEYSFAPPPLLLTPCQVLMTIYNKTMRWLYTNGYVKVYLLDIIAIRLSITKKSSFGYCFNEIVAMQWPKDRPRDGREEEERKFRYNLSVKYRYNLKSTFLAWCIFLAKKISLHACFCIKFILLY